MSSGSAFPWMMKVIRDRTTGEIKSALIRLGGWAPMCCSSTRSSVRRGQRPKLGRSLENGSSAPPASVLRQSSRGTRLNRPPLQALTLRISKLFEQLASKEFKSSTCIFPQCSRRIVWHWGRGARERSLIRLVWRFKWPRRDNVPRSDRYPKSIVGSGGTSSSGQQIVMYSRWGKKEVNERSLPHDPLAFMSVREVNPGLR